MGVSQQTQKRVLLFFIVLNGVVTPGGMIYGWPGLAQMLKDSRQYAADCPSDWDPHNGVACVSQDKRLSTIYTVGANLATVGTVVYGFTLDRFGVRSNAVSGAALMCGGFLMLAYSDSQHFDGFLPGFSLIAFGGLGTYLPAFQFACLFSRPTLILSLLASLFGVSGLLFTLFKWLLEEHGVARETSCMLYAALVAFCGLSMALLYPKDGYRAGDSIHLPVLGWIGLQQPPPQKDQPPLLAFQQDPQPIISSSPFAGEEPEPAHSPQVEIVTVTPMATPGGSSFVAPLPQYHISHLDASLLRGDPSAYKALPTEADSNSTAAAAANGHGRSRARGSSASSTSSASSSDAGAEVGYSAEEIEELKLARRQRELTSSELAALKGSRSLRDELLDPGTLLLALHFSVGLLTVNVYNANIATILQQMGDTSGNMANAFVIIATVYPCFFNLVFDRLLQRFRYAGVSCLCTTLLAASYAWLLWRNQYAQVAGFFLFGTGRALLITIMFSFAAAEYRPEHYGRVIAAATILCAAVGTAQFGVSALISGPLQGHNFTPLIVGMILALVPLYSFSYWCAKQRI